jgi:hypothetical protein
VYNVAIRQGHLARPAISHLGRVTLRRRVGVPATWSATYVSPAGAVGPGIGRAL